MVGERPHHNRGPIPGRWQLNDRQLDVAFHVTEGLSNVEIGERMGLTANTVKTYLSDALETLRLTGRVQLAVWYVRTFEMPHQ